MTIVLPARRFRAWPVSLCLVLLFGVGQLRAETSVKGAAGQSQPAPAVSTVASGMHGVIQLDGPWRFQMGDDPRWADPAFDDSAWPTMTLGKALSEQGFESYAGYGWYRLRLNPQQLQFGSQGVNSPLDLLITSHSVGQLAVYLNGVEAGHTVGMTSQPAMYLSPPIAVSLPAAAAGDTIVIAIRSWAAPGIPITHGLLEGVEAGAHADVADRLALSIARRWDQNVIAGLIVMLQFLGVAGLALILYLSQKHHSEYLWLSVLCLSVAIPSSFALAYQLTLLPSSVYSVLSLWTGWLFMAATLEFVVRFTAAANPNPIRSIQAAVLFLPVISLLHFQRFYDVLSASAGIAFCVLVCVLLFRAWRRGLREAGVMLVPFLLAAVADFIDTLLGFAARLHWISEGMAYHRFHVGPIEYGTSDLTFSIFLGSLIAVILYRFVRVSQEEQRSSAEIAAARSVQAMLIPTELPSNNYFMLESAYVPANGVGGDFFQVLPVDDGSLLLVVGDVSGKGLQAAMNASTLVGAFRNELSHEPATILNHLNNVLLGATTGAGRNKDSVISFATCLCARIFRDGTMTIANAGHLSPYRDGREMELSPGLPLGVIAGVPYDQEIFQLEQGMRLIFLSDGVVEAANPHGELFGFERTQQVSNEPARYIAQTAKRFGQNDDITVISVYIASRDAKGAARELAGVN